MSEVLNKTIETLLNFYNKQIQLKFVSSICLQTQSFFFTFDVSHFILWQRLLTEPYDFFVVHKSLIVLKFVGSLLDWIQNIKNYVQVTYKVKLNAI